VTSIEFKYVEDYERCAVELDNDTPCAVCGDADELRWRRFSSVKEVGAVCVQCVARGFPDWVHQGRDGDADELRQQLRELHPDWSADQVDTDAKAKNAELARRTPPILSWQDWAWPACCGDYCRFLQHAGQPDITELAKHRRLSDGVELLRQSLVEAKPSAEEVWSFLPPKRVTAASNWGTQAYVFKCLTCKRLRVVWDAC
jgi:hypothetical protein